jgi:dihydroorotate dehydrogenase
MYSLLRTVLFLLPPEFAHYCTLTMLKCSHQLRLLPLVTSNKPCIPMTCMGLRFENPVGLAAGLDKNGEFIDALAQLGFGFIEVGTVTPKPQPGKEKPRLFRLPKEYALINRMGFNNKGVDYLVRQIQKSRYRGILGINIGKNAATPLHAAAEDYLICMEKVYPYASYIVINISSPNTQDLRQLQYGDTFSDFIARLKQQQEILQKQHLRYVPLVVKVAPDLDQAQIKMIAGVVLHYGIDGLTVSNTTCSRETIKKHPLRHEQGGLSGAPLHSLSCDVIQAFNNELRDRIPIIGVGGIMSAYDAQQTFSAGAQLIQLYTGLIYRGAGLVKEILDEGNDR